MGNAKQICKRCESAYAEVDGIYCSECMNEIFGLEPDHLHVEHEPVKMCVICLENEVQYGKDICKKCDNKTAKRSRKTKNKKVQWQVIEHGKVFLVPIPYFKQGLEKSPLFEKTPKSSEFTDKLPFSRN